MEGKEGGTEDVEEKCDMGVASYRREVEAEERDGRVVEGMEGGVA